LSAFPILVRPIRHKVLPPSATAINAGSGDLVRLMEAIQGNAARGSAALWRVIDPLL